MKTLVEKVRIVHVLLFAVSVLAALFIAIIVSQQGKINRLNGEVTDLNNVIAGEKQAHDDVLGDTATLSADKETLSAENSTLKSENNALKAENESLEEENTALKGYQLTITVPNKHEIVIDQRLEQETVDLIKRHFAAIAAGNIDEYRSTLGDPGSTYLLGFFREHKGTRLEVTAISVPNATYDGMFVNGGFFVTVSYRQDGQVGRYSDIGVTIKDGKWVIYDYD